MGFTVEEALSFIKSRSRFGSKPGLTRQRLLHSKLGNPENRIPVVHIAGTNGKGSTATLISYALRESGYKIGVFTSPYLIEPYEQFVINGQKIAEQEFAELIFEISSAVVEVEAELTDEITEYEIFTCAAYLYFYKQKCDFAVIETGMGGELDATNVVENTAVSVITSVALDHMQFLGDTVEKIARTKCGIFKKGRPAVVYPNEPREALDMAVKCAAEKSCPFYTAYPREIADVKTDVYGTEFSFRGTTYHVPLLGHHQAYNASVAVMALKALLQNAPENNCLWSYPNDFNVSDEDIKRGFMKAIWPCRMEKMRDYPAVFADGGHNPDCAEAIKAVIDECFKGVQPILVIGMFADKDYAETTSILFPAAKRIFTVTPVHPRALDGRELAAECPEKATYSGSVTQGINDALNFASEKDVVLICGSFSLYPETVRYFTSH